MWGWWEKLTGVIVKNYTTNTLVLTKEYQRARTKRGRFKGDDKSTPEVNEAWVGGTSPKKKVYKIKGRKYTLKKVIKERK